MFSFQKKGINHFDIQFPPAGGPRIRKLNIFGETEKTEKNWKNLLHFRRIFLKEMSRKFSVSARIFGSRILGPPAGGNWKFSRKLKNFSSFQIRKSGENGAKNFQFFQFFQFFRFFQFLRKFSVSGFSGRRPAETENFSGNWKFSAHFL